MRPLYWPSVLLLVLASSLPAQTRTIAERLGYPAQTKLLILHADDLGVAHSEDVASFAALDRGAVSSASVMMPTPWVTEVAGYAKAHPDADIGLHLTLTSEWQTYRWGSVASRDSVRSLLDTAGLFPADVPPVAAAKPAEVERELRAQIARALALGIHPTHIDSHMGALFATPDLIATYVKVAHECHLPFLAVKQLARAAPGAPFTDRDIMLDTVVIAGPDVPRDQWKAFYLNAIARLRPGLSEMIVHLGHDDAELRAVTVDHEPYGAAWRQRDYDVVTSPEFRQALQEHHVVLVRWRDVYRAAQQP
ncbi:MAG TPA: polysaccharide deacetylase family protein [Gemmatimonadaceae bacterium]|nr:polysaccharide deacetylase family protein [Gemmatimonadaceae bacterium]